MDLSEHLAGRTVEHLNKNRQYGDRIRRVSRDCVDIFRIFFLFRCEEKSLDVIIDPPEEDLETLKGHLEKIRTRKYWQNPSLALLKENRKKYRLFLKNPRIEKGENGHYHFRAEFISENKEDIFFSMLNYAVKPVLLYLRTKQ